MREEPASVGQRVLWQMEHHRGAHGALNCPLLLRLDGPLEIAALQAALDALARRHEILRTTFAGRGPRLRQVIHSDPLALSIDEVDLSDQTAPQDALTKAIAEEVATPTDLEQAPMRVSSWRLTAEQRVLCVNMHHLITDGWSTAVVASELAQLYGHILAEAPAPPRVIWQYADWAGWHREQLRGERLRQLQAYWRDRLAGAKLPGLPRLNSSVPPMERRTVVVRARLGADVVHALQAFARTHGATFLACLLSVYYALLRRETGDGDLAIGSIFANRSRREARATLGFLSNMVLLRARLHPRMTFTELVRAADETVVGAFMHQELPFQMLALDAIDATSMRPDAAVFQLFTGPMRAARIGEVAFEPMIHVPEGVGSRWEFELSLAPAEDGLAVLLCYASDLYDRPWARGLVDGYVALARILVDESDAPIAAVGSSG
jgi:hypothetical protein